MSELPESLTVTRGEISVMLRRMEALASAITDRTDAPHRRQMRLEFHFDQVLRAMTKAFDPSKSG